MLNIAYLARNNLDNYQYARKQKAANLNEISGFSMFNGGGGEI